jgi:hypothetical protein
LAASSSKPAPFLFFELKVKSSTFVGFDLFLAAGSASSAAFLAFSRPFSSRRPFWLVAGGGFGDGFRSLLVLSRQACRGGDDVGELAQRLGGERVLEFSQ